MKRSCSHLIILTTIFIALAMCIILPSCLKSASSSSQKKTFCQKNDAGTPAICNIGDYITFGHYEQDNDTPNGKEPIHWRILDKNDKGQYLIISDEILEVKPYNTTQIVINWEKSTIRSWLNGYDDSYNTVGNNYVSDNFIDTAFTSEEKNRIIASNLSTDATTDKIFLLSADEAKKYFSGDEDRSTDATNYAIEHGLRVVTACEAITGYCHQPKYRHRSFWWLRSTRTTEQLFAEQVANLGYISYFLVDRSDEGGVRPALWLQL